MQILIGAFIAFLISYILWAIAERLDKKAAMKNLKALDPNITIYCWDNVDQSFKLFDSLVEFYKETIEGKCKVCETETGLYAVFQHDQQVTQTVTLIDTKLSGAKLVNTSKFWLVDQSMPLSRFLDILAQDDYKLECGRDIRTFDDETQIRLEK